MSEAEGLNIEEQNLTKGSDPISARELSPGEFKKKYGFTRQGDVEPKPFLARLHEASQGWGRLGVFIQGIIFNKALSNLGARRDSQEGRENV